MDKKTRMFFAKIALAFAIAAAVLGLVFQKGANHPPLRFSFIPKSALDRVAELSKDQWHNARAIIKKQGPFKWSNNDDLGSGKELGVWNNESNHDAIVYYHRDKDAVGQARAFKVLESFDWITDELYDFLGDKLNSDSLNNRKIPVYMASDDGEYQKVMDKLSGGSRTPSNREGCSFIEIGPLGCINRGIVLNSSTAFETDEYGEYAFVPILRRELARYTYMNLNDYGQDGTQCEWFVDGLIEYFTNGCGDSIYYSQELIDYIDNDFSLTKNPVKNKYALQAGVSFIYYLELFQNEIPLEDMISYSYSHNIAEFFKEKEIDVDSVKLSWVVTLQQIADAITTGEEM